MNNSTNKLRAKIIEKNFTITKLAKTIDMDRTTLYRKIRNIKMFRLGEVIQIINVLGLNIEEAADIFLIVNSQKRENKEEVNVNGENARC